MHMPSRSSGGESRQDDALAHLALAQAIDKPPSTSAGRALIRQSSDQALDLVGADGTQGAIILWSGQNAFKAMLAAGDFQDRKRILQRRIDTDRQFEIVMEPTRMSFEASGKRVADARSVLLVSGRSTTGTPIEFFKEAMSQDGGAEMGQTAGGIPGVVGQLFLAGTHGREAQLTCACYLFIDEQSLDQFLASGLWAKVQAEMRWEEMKVERFAVASGAASAA